MTTFIISEPYDSLAYCVFGITRRISGFQFRITNVQNPPVCRLSIQRLAVDIPDGTMLARKEFTPTEGLRIVTFEERFTPTVPEWLAFVIEWNDADFSRKDSSVTLDMGNMRVPFHDSPFVCSYDGFVWTKHSRLPEVIVY